MSEERYSKKLAALLKVAETYKPRPTNTSANKARRDVKKALEIHRLVSSVTKNGLTNNRKANINRLIKNARQRLKNRVSQKK